MLLIRKRRACLQAQRDVTADPRRRARVVRLGVSLGVSLLLDRDRADVVVAASKTSGTAATIARKARARVGAEKSVDLLPRSRPRKEVGLGIIAEYLSVKTHAELDLQPSPSLSSRGWQAANQLKAVACRLK